MSPWLLLKKHSPCVSIKRGQKVQGEQLLIAANAVFFTDDPMDLSSHGIETAELRALEAYLEKSTPTVMALDCSHGPSPGDFHSLYREHCLKNGTQLILVYQGLSTSELIHWQNQFHPRFFIEKSEIHRLPQLFQESFSHFFANQQRSQLIELVNEKNEELKRLLTQLENKVEERQHQLEDSKQKSLEAERRLQILKETLIQVYQAASISEVEHNILQVIGSEFNISWVQIRGNSQSNLEQKKGEFKSYRVTLKSGQRDFGQMTFYKEKKHSFQKKEKGFLSQVADAVSLSIDRTLQQQRSQELKKQWEATFDAISDPICLTDEDYNILRVNAGFIKKTKSLSVHSPLGEKCYQQLFHRTEPCSGCQRGQVFQIRNPRRMKQSEIFDVYSDRLEQDQTPVYFQMYRDVTQDLNLQRQVIETAKMAELGTISSSMAHELNNPIGGMLNFIQLMKMDLNGDEDFYEDIVEIEKGILKCKDIVKNLLGFSRKSFHNEVQDIYLKEVIEQAIMITELKTRSMGIPIHFDCDDGEIFISGRFNRLTHAIRNILQNAQESLISKRKSDKNFKGRIEVHLGQSPQEIFVEITDNGDGIPEKIKHQIFDPLFTTKAPETNSGLGLTLALQIVEEHRGHIFVSTGKDKKLSFKLLFSKSEVQSGAPE